MVKFYNRPLSEQDLKLLRGESSRISQRRKRIRRRAWFSIPILLVAGIPVSIALSKLESSGLGYGTYFFICIVCLFWVWEAINTKQDQKQLSNIEAAIARNEARVVHCQSNAMVYFEEIEDEGADYCFQVEDSRLLFISGQEFYETTRFPNTDFELVTAVGNNRYQVLFHIYCHGQKLKPLRVIPADVKKKLALPEHLTVVEGSLDHLEQLLAVKPK